MVKLVSLVSLLGLLILLLVSCEGSAEVQVDEEGNITGTVTTPTAFVDPIERPELPGDTLTRTNEIGQYLVPDGTYMSDLHGSDRVLEVSGNIISIVNRFEEPVIGKKVPNFPELGGHIYTFETKGNRPDFDTNIIFKGGIALTDTITRRYINVSLDYVEGMEILILNGESYRLGGF